MGNFKEIKINFFKKQKIYLSCFNSVILEKLKNEHNLKILDVGCNKGDLGYFLKRNNNIVYGIDISEKAISIASKLLDKAWNIDIEKNPVPTSERDFNVIIFGDILEHLYNPKEIIQKYLPYLKSNGRVIISVPNIANIGKRIGLVLGRFEYANEGLLDFSHIRFFTLKTIKNLIYDVGLEIIDIDVTCTKPKILFFIPQNIMKKIAELWKSFFAYQFIIVCKKTRYEES